MNAPHRPDRVAVRYGLGWGGAAAVLGIGSGVTAAFIQVNQSNHVALLPCCLFGIFLVWVLSVPGHETARHTRSVAAGTLAGALAGGLGSIGFTIGSNVTLAFLQPNSAHFPVAVVIGGVVGVIVNACYFAGLGAICSLVGAIIGRAGIFAPDVRPAPRPQPVPTDDQQQRGTW